MCRLLFIIHNRINTRAADAALWVGCFMRFARGEGGIAGKWMSENEYQDSPCILSRVFSGPSMENWEKSPRLFGLFLKMNRSRSRPWRARKPETPQSPFFLFSLSLSFRGLRFRRYFEETRLNQAISLTRSDDRSLILRRSIMSLHCASTRRELITPFPFSEYR